MIKAEIEDGCLEEGMVLKDIYEIEAIISKGELGIIYLGYDLKKKEKCVIKEYYPNKLALRDIDKKMVLCKSSKLKEKYYNLRDIFLNEGVLLKKFNHKNIATYITHFIENNTGYIVIKYYEGQSLEQYIKENKKECTGDFLKRIFIPLINTIDVIHKKNIIHRDIKPSNILINKDGEPVIIDFGSAIEYKVCENKKIFVTSGFSPIEFYSEKSKQGIYSDIYSLSATLYYYLCKKVPLEVSQRVIEDDLEDIKKYNKEISLFFSRVVMKNLSLPYKKRFFSAKLFKICLYIEYFILKIKKGILRYVLTN